MTSDTGTPPVRALIADDDPAAAAAIAGALRKEGIRTAHVTTLKEAVSAASATRPDVVVLDLSMPDGDGRAIIGRLVRDTGTAVIVCSGDAAASSRVVCLEAGAEDYVVKPITPRELALRVHRIARRGDRTAGAIIMLGGARIDPADLTISSSAGTTRLRRRAFSILKELVAAQGGTMGRRELIDRIWGGDGGSSSSLTEQIRAVRAAVEPHGIRIVTVRSRDGGGYRLEA